MLKKFFTSVLFILFSFVLPSSLVAQSFYWESPERISTSDSRFPSAVSNNQNAAIFWQEIDGNQIWLSGQFKRGSVVGESTEASATSSSNSTWQTRRRFAGPFPYSGSIPDLYSSAMSKKGTIVVSVLSDPSTISLFISDKSFSLNIFSLSLLCFSSMSCNCPVSSMEHTMLLHPTFSPSLA